MPAAKHTLFEAWSAEGREFSRMWNSAKGGGVQNDISRRFGISVALVGRVRRKLNLPLLHSPDRPGKRRVLKIVRKRHYAGWSSSRIARALRFSPERVRQLISQMGLEPHPKHVTDALYYPARNSSLTPKQLYTAIKERYVDKGASAAKIAKEMGIDQGTVRTKLKALGVQLRQRHGRVLMGGYPCQWCAAVMQTVYHNKGLRKQLYCSASCRNYAKDYRRMKLGARFSETRMEAMERFLKNSWQGSCEDAVKRLLQPKKFGASE